jgi:hypothetical protein
MSGEADLEDVMNETLKVVVDKWVHAALARTYDNVLAEPIPDDLLALLEPFG